MPCKGRENAGSITGFGLDVPVASVKGIGPKIARALEKRDIRTVEDLFYFLPLRYEDKKFIRPIRDIVEGEENVLLARVVEAGPAYSRATRKRLYLARVDDGTGTIVLKWFRFHRGWGGGMARKGTLLFLSGKVTRYGPDLQMVHPRVTVVREEQEREALGALVPVYPEVEGVSQGALRRIMEEAFTAFQPGVASMVPPGIEASLGLLSLSQALRACHFPETEPSREGGRRASSARMILEEFFLFQAALLMRRREIKRAKGVRLAPGRIHAHMTASLPFALTGAQARALREIEGDMARGEPMNRLLQGDVGSGKTICAIFAACAALDSGYQVAFMAPTEILAEQHYLNIHGMLEQVEVRPVLVRGNMGRERAHVLEGIASGGIKVIVGTHALLGEGVRFLRLGLIVIDEQHRFGVTQRSLLKGKGASPDILVMSATPIPRTLSMVVYGDLDVSLIDDLPGGRQHVATEVKTVQERQRVYDAVREEVGKGRQAFIVYPLLEESEGIDLLGAKESLLRLREVFPSFRIGLLHGRMKAEKKEEVMLLFKERRLDVLVCTTVIEVGIDVPNATLMVVEHAERFGLSQLHQLRGRVGRGPEPSRCFLVSGAGGSANATKRLRVLERTGDGFVIAEEDMRLRGPGDMLGVRQAGLPAFRIGDLFRDGDLMGQARRMAEEALTSGGRRELAALGEAVARRWGGRLHLGDVL